MFLRNVFFIEIIIVYMFFLDIYGLLLFLTVRLLCNVFFIEIIIVYMFFLDIYGLLLFLTVRPYNCKLWWKRALLDQYRAGNYKPLFELTSRVMWRTCKSDVEEQICLPKQTEYISWLLFSAVEQHFYQKQQDVSARNTAYSLTHNFSYLGESLKLTDLNKQTLSKLLAPLLNLRQACCHPAVVRNSHLSMEKKFMTMDQLLGQLTASAKLESEEAHRKLLCAMNGLAGVEILMDNHNRAIEIYHDAISSWESYKHLKTDSLQVTNILAVFFCRGSTVLKS